MAQNNGTIRLKGVERAGIKITKLQESSLMRMEPGDYAYEATRLFNFLSDSLPTGTMTELEKLIRAREERLNQMLGRKMLR